LTESDAIFDLTTIQRVFVKISTLARPNICRIQQRVPNSLYFRRLLANAM